MTSTALHRPRPRQQGLVLLAILLFILIATLAACSMVQLYQTQTQREKEEQLLFVGDQYRRAIHSYFNAFPPGSARALPQSLDALLYDVRFPTAMQHLRRLYPDPMTGQADWQLVGDSNGIVGVRSRSTLAPFKVSDFAKPYKAFENKTSYADWMFSIQVK
jgi:type II secretory pathway pseudopilin PulG